MDETYLHTRAVKKYHEKARLIVAMLFWEWRKDKRLHGVLSDYTETSEDLFMKAYKILKG